MEQYQTPSNLNRASDDLSVPMLQAKVFDMSLYLMRLNEVIRCMMTEQKENITPGCAKIFDRVLCGIQRTLSIAEGATIDSRKEFQRISTELGALRNSKYLNIESSSSSSHAPTCPNLNDEGEWKFFKLANVV